jgi:methylmalonyl-CoA mutase cobalamin-binding subunit
VSPWRRQGDRERRSVVAVMGSARASDSVAQAPAESLPSYGVEAVYLGRLESPRHLATATVKERATTIELCLARSGRVSWLRELLRELARVGRRDVSVVVHRTE